LDLSAVNDILKSWKKDDITPILFTKKRSGMIYNRISIPLETNNKFL